MLNRFFNPVARVTFGLVGLSISLVFAAKFLGFIPDGRDMTLQSRKTLTEAVAMTFSSMANRIDAIQMKDHLAKVAQRYDEIKTLGLRKADGSEILAIGSHFENWDLTPGEASTADEISIPIYGDQEKAWGYIEFDFADSRANGWLEELRNSEYALAAFFGLLGFVAFYFYLRFALRQLSPSRVVPQRVRDALDTLAEGLVVVDNQKRVVLANKALQESTGQTREKLIGQSIDSLPFITASPESELPWETVLATGEPVRGCLMRGDGAGDQFTFLVSCAPIVDDQGNNRGGIASFEDVTQLQRKTVRLEQMFQELDASTEEIKRQNRELEFLATRDPLTSCMNRRSFFEAFEDRFAVAVKECLPLSAIMVDIDHFKSINDNHGHAIGDEVLKLVAATLESSVRRSDIVCRYGGEEFSILLPETDIDAAVEVAEKTRTMIESLHPADLDITASLGVSQIEDGVDSPQDLLEHADQCLYVAKRQGRNRVIRWDKVDSQDLVSDQNSGDEALRNQVPFQAVNALMSALSYRDQETADHCRRVADLCVAVGEGLLSRDERYLLEIAGLLHDIGKVGVPDSILLKPEPLTSDQWKALRRHQLSGVELVKTTFDCHPLNEIITNYRRPQSDYSKTGVQISVSARILKIVDAFDSMTSSKAYRKAMSTDQAVAELRKCGGHQFDGELVERVAQVIQVRGVKLTPGAEGPLGGIKLDLGRQIERLAEALENGDHQSIGVIADRLSKTAAKHGATEIAEKANQISLEIGGDNELFNLIRCTNELTELCRESLKATAGC